MHPNLFQIGIFTVHSYGLLLALAFLTGLQVAIYYGRKEGISSAQMTDLVLYAFVAALVGAKLLQIVVDFSYYRRDWSRLLNLYQVGGVYYGGLILAVLVSVVYMRLKRLNFWQTADAMCMGIASGQILGRIGCFLAGCCWGRACAADFPLGVTFRNADAATQVGTPLFLALHPTQLYEAGAMILVFAILAAAYKFKRFQGEQFFRYLFLYSTIRFTIEFFRGDPRGFVFNGLLSTSQLISLLILLATTIAYALRKRIGLTPVQAVS